MNLGATTIRFLQPCPHCGEDFEPRSAHHTFCSERCRYHARDAGTPALVTRTRERCRAWAEQHRGVTRAQPWLYGAPPSDTHLPGAVLPLRIHPLERGIEPQHAHALHGLVTKLRARPHHPTVPDFALIPWHQGAQWAVWFRDMDDVQRLAGTRHPGQRVLSRIGVEVRFGGAIRIKAPKLTKRNGRRRVRIEALTPVLLRKNASSGMITVPTAGNLCSTLALWTPPRLGVELRQDSVRLEIVERNTEPASVWCGPKLKAARGFVGSVVVECNAPAEWLLRGCELAGLGGRTAYGLGRIAVREVTG